MTRLNALLAALVFTLLPAWAQTTVLPKTTVLPHTTLIAGGSAAVNTYSFVAKSSGDFVSCSTATCSLTITSTGAGHLLVLSGQTSSFDGITAVTCAGCGSWVEPATCVQTDGSIGEISCAYITSVAGSVTSLTITTSNASGGTYYFRVTELSATGTITFDTCNHVDNSTGGTTQPGTALTLTGTNDGIVQFAGIPANSITAISGGYTLNTGPGHDSVLDAYIVNTASGTAPNWTLNASQPLEGGACAFK